MSSRSRGRTGPTKRKAVTISEENEYVPSTSQEGSYSIEEGKEEPEMTEQEYEEFQRRQTEKLRQAHPELQTGIIPGRKLNNQEMRLLQREFKDQQQVLQEYKEQGEEPDEGVIPLVETDEDGKEVEFYPERCVTDGFTGVDENKDGDLQFDEKANYCLHYLDEWFDQLLILFRGLDIGGIEVLENADQMIQQTFENIPADAIRIRFTPIPEEENENFEQLSQVFRDTTVWTLEATDIQQQLFLASQRTELAQRRGLNTPVQVEIPVLSRQTFANIERGIIETEQQEFDRNVYIKLLEWIKQQYSFGYTVQFELRIEFPIPLPPKQVPDAIPTEVIINSVVSDEGEVFNPIMWDTGIVRPVTLSTITGRLEPGKAYAEITLETTGEDYFEPAEGNEEQSSNNATSNESNY